MNFEAQPAHRMHAMEETQKITIIEGPPPTFEMVNDTWLLGLTEGPEPMRVASCQVRTHNGPALVERCHRAWRNGHPIHLEFRGEDGLTRQAAIISARWTERLEGQVLFLWVQLHDDEVEVELGYDVGDVGDSLDDDPDDAGFDPSL
jgi:hypothetical protein